MNKEISLKKKNSTFNEDRYLKKEKRVLKKTREY